MVLLKVLLFTLMLIADIVSAAESIFEFREGEFLCFLLLTFIVGIWHEVLSEGDSSILRIAMAHFWKDFFQFIGQYGFGYFSGCNHIFFASFFTPVLIQVKHHIFGYAFLIALVYH